MENTAPTQTGFVNERTSNNHRLQSSVNVASMCYFLRVHQCMRYANRSNRNCVDNYLLTSQLVFWPLLRRVLTRELPLPGTSVSSVQPYPYPGLLWVLYNPIRTRNVSEFCTTFIPVPELSVFVSSVGYTQNHTRGIHGGYHPSKNFWNFCRTLIPVPGTSGSSVRRCHKDPG